MKLVIFGKSRTGKTTIANYLKYQYGFCHINLSEPIKTICRNIYSDMNIDPQYHDNLLFDDEKDYNFTFFKGKNSRLLMQLIGDYFRIIGNNQIDVLADIAVRKSKEYDNVVIGDGRTTKEFKFFQQNNFETIKKIGDSHNDPKKTIMNIAGDNINLEIISKNMIDFFQKIDNPYINNASESNIILEYSQYVINLMNLTNTFSENHKTEKEIGQINNKDFDYCVYPKSKIEDVFIEIDKIISINNIENKSNNKLN